LKTEELVVKPLNFTLSKRVTFPIANEDLTPIAKTLRKLKDMTYYLGICGGGTQNLYLLQVLSKSNKFKWRRLIDNDREQLLNFMDLKEALVYSKDDLHYLSKLAKRQHRVEGIYDRYFYFLFKNRSNGFEETNLKRPKLKNMEIELVYSEFFKYINTEKLPRGKYFIYLSNIFSYTKMSRRLWWIRRWYILKELYHGNFKTPRLKAELNHTTKELQNTIGKNKNILDGSVILVWMGGVLLRTKHKSIVLFKKSNHKVEILVEVPLIHNDIDRLG
jgi:hypothetical protein